IQVNDNGGGWTEWIPTPTATSAPYSAQDGHTYQFRSLATDRAGNVESASGNDSWTIVDMSPPDSTVSVLPPYETALQFTIAWGPVAGTTDIATYRIQVRDGSGAWTDVSGYSSTTATSTTFVGVDGHAYGFRSLAQDRAGNSMTQSRTFQFSTAGGLASGFSLADNWWLLVLVGALAGGALFLIMRRRAAAPAKPPAVTVSKESDAIVEDVFLLNHRDGVLIKHETRRLRPDVDTDILSGMLTA